MCFGPFVAGQRLPQLLWIPALHLCLKLKVDNSSLVVSHSVTHFVGCSHLNGSSHMRTQEPTSPLSAALCVFVFGLLNHDWLNLRYFLF